jgi:hypothetical protein
MSFKELKTILKDDKIKKTKTEEYIIRKIMKQKYDKYIRYKELHEVSINNTNIQELDDLCLELESGNQTKKKYDKPNPNIDRLSNDLDIQNIYKNKNKNKKTVITPYSDSSNNFGSYAPCI